MRRDRYHHMCLRLTGLVRVRQFAPFFLRKIPAANRMRVVAPLRAATFLEAAYIPGLDRMHLSIRRLQGKTGWQLLQRNGRTARLGF